MPLEWLFGKKKTPEEMLRQNQRALNKAMRDLDRERQKMEQQEKKVIADIKKMAKQGQMVGTSSLVKQSLTRECNIHILCDIHMSRVIRKPTFYICENKDADQLRGDREADQRLCYTPPPQNIVLGGYTVFSLSVLPSFRHSVHI